MEKIKNELISYFDGFCSYMEQDTKGVEVGIYAVSGIVFAVAYHKIRPITKFVKPSSIPSHFIREKLPQSGVIKRIEPQLSGPIVCVSHKPPVNLFFASKKTLPVKISGIEINSNGYSWLQSVTLNKRVKFIPLATTEDHAECQVFMLSEFKHKKNLDLADALLSLGFAKITTPLPALVADDKLVAQYFKRLASSEKRARRERVGVWLSTIPPPIWPLRMFSKIVHNSMVSIMPPGRRLPQLVR